MIRSKRRVLRHTGNSTSALAQNPQHTFAANYAQHVFGSNSIYTFIPKCACSTLRYSVAIDNGAIEGPDDAHWIHLNNTTFKADLKSLMTADYSFVVLRDPFRRLVSCYLDKIVGKTPVAWQLHTATARTIDLDTLSFRGFVDSVAGKLRLNEHWRPQADFLIYKDYDDYFCVEDFSRAERVLLDRIDLKIEDARGLTLHGTDRHVHDDSHEPAADAPAHALAERRRQGFVPRVESFYDEDLVKSVGRLYAEDLALYKDKIGRPCLY